VGTLSHRSYWLELRSPEELRPKSFALAGVELARLRGDEHARARRLWFEVGRGFWSEREDWPPERWHAHLDGASTRFIAATLAAEEVGCFELVRERDEVQMEGFGLLPAWRGRGLGAGLLTAATREAFALGARRIWLRTATDDHPHALPNYLARGYRVFREEPLANPMPGRGPR
jgi:ribosomal protein S18 acetylase RimI-like enzyme